MNSSLLWTFLLLAAYGPAAKDVDHVPRFQDFRVASVYHGKIKAPQFKDLKRNKELRDPVKRTGISSFPWKWQMETVTQRHIDFAGHYIFVSGSAGGNSALFNAVDAKTGFIYPFPYELKVQTNRQYAHQADHGQDSRLVVLHGFLFDESQAQPDLPFGDHYFVFSKHSFVYVGSVLLSKQHRTARRGARVLVTYRNSSQTMPRGKSGPTLSP